MRAKLFLIVPVAAVLAGCGRGQQEGRLVVSKTQDTLNITAYCTADNQVHVGLDKWVVDIKKQGDIDWVLLPVPTTPAGNVLATVDIQPKLAGGDNWAFDDPPPINPNANSPTRKKVKNIPNKKTFQYLMNVSCTVNGVTNRVIIDPDIIVD